MLKRLTILCLLILAVFALNCSSKNYLEFTQVTGIQNFLEIDRDKPSFLIHYRIFYQNEKPDLKQELLNKTSEIKDTVKLYFENINSLKNISNLKVFESNIASYINDLLDNGKINSFKILQLKLLKPPFSSM